MGFLPPGHLERRAKARWADNAGVYVRELVQLSQMAPDDPRWQELEAILGPLPHAMARVPENSFTDLVVLLWRPDREGNDRR
jgi:hypothetical protein